MDQLAISVRRVAELLDVHPNTVKRIDPADLPYFRVARRGDRRYWVTDVFTYIGARATPVTAPAVRKSSAYLGPITREDVDDLYGGVPPEGREVL